MPHAADVASELRAQLADSLLAVAGSPVREMTEEGLHAWLATCAASDFRTGGDAHRVKAILSLTLEDFRAAEDRRVNLATKDAPARVRRLVRAHRAGMPVKPRHASTCGVRREPSRRGRAPRSRRVGARAASRGSPRLSDDDPPRPDLARRPPALLVEWELEELPRVAVRADSHEDELRLRHLLVRPSTTQYLLDAILDALGEAA